MSTCLRLSLQVDLVIYTADDLILFFLLICYGTLN